MKIHRNYLKSIIKECLDEILSEIDNPEVISPDEDPKVKKLRKDVENKKQAVEREKLKSLDVNMKAAQAKKIAAIDPVAKKAADDEVKNIAGKKDASKAAMNAAIKSASSIK